jgi:tyrosyl-tRNA synthetase
VLPAEEQSHVISSGTADMVPASDMARKLAKGTPLRIKLGVDPTAPDLHVGHTVLIQKLKQFQDLGHDVCFLIGDFTGMIGDPTGKSETRKALTREDVLRNAETYKAQVFKILDPAKTRVVFNSEWLMKMTASDMIALAAKSTVARMLERDDFGKRYANQLPISIHEFLYPLIQGYDSVALQADVELGGTDQKFNLLMGRELQKQSGQSPQAVVTMPLLEGLDGVNKMSKSLGNYIGITEPAKEIYGKVMSISDELMLRYYELLSDVDLATLQKVRDGVAGQQGGHHPMESKKALARELVARFYDQAEAQKAEEDFVHQFKQKEVPDDIQTVRIVSAGPIWICRLLTEAGLVASNGEARRLIQQGGVKIDGEKAANPDQEIAPQGEMVLQAGKRRFARVVFSSN